MKPSELYEREADLISDDISHLWGFYYSHVPEIEQYTVDEDKNDRIQIHYYKQFCFDGRRTWVLAAVSIDNKFVMVTQNAGREGDDHSERFITDYDLYGEMLKYLRSLLLTDAVENKDIVDPETDIPMLDEFYGNKLDGDFKHY